MRPGNEAKVECVAVEALHDENVLSFHVSSDLRKRRTVTMLEVTRVGRKRNWAPTPTGKPMHFLPLQCWLLDGLGFV